MPSIPPLARDARPFDDDDRKARGYLGNSAQNFRSACANAAGDAAKEEIQKMPQAEFLQLQSRLRAMLPPALRDIPVKMGSTGNDYYRITYENGEFGVEVTSKGAEKVRAMQRQGGGAPVGKRPPYAPPHNL